MKYVVHKLDLKGSELEFETYDEAIKVFAFNLEEDSKIKEYLDDVWLLEEKYETEGSITYHKLKGIIVKDFKNLTKKQKTKLLEG